MTAICYTTDAAVMCHMNAQMAGPRCQPLLLLVGLRLCSRRIELAKSVPHDRIEPLVWRRQLHLQLVENLIAKSRVQRLDGRQRHGRQIVGQAELSSHSRDRDGGGGH